MQQVNLLTEDLTARSAPLQARHLLIVWAGFLFVLLTFTGWQAFTLWGLKNEMATTRAELSELAAANAQQRATLIDPDALRKQVGALRDRQLAQGELVNLLQGHRFSGGFATYMQGLAAANVKGLWLTEIHLYQRVGRADKKQLTLKGTALEAPAVPRLLQNLAMLEQFAGQRFQQIELNAASDSDLVEFVIASPADGDAG